MSNTNGVTLENKIMDKVMSGEIKMKPRWYFVLGSIASFAGLVGLIMGAVFLTNLTMFLLLKRGPGTGRLLLMLESFPVWVPALAILFMVLGTLLLKRYEFSYKRNLTMLALAFVAAVVLSAFTIYSLGLDDIWFKRGPMRLIYPNEYPYGTRKYHFNTRQ